MPRWTDKEVAELAGVLGPKGLARNPHLAAFIGKSGYVDVTQEMREENHSLLEEVTKMRHALDLEVTILLKDYLAKYGRSYYGGTSND